MKKSLLQEQLLKISFSDSEYIELKKNADYVINELKKQGISAYIGGSFAKKTVVKKQGIQDIDIFVVFNKESETSTLDKYLKKIKSNLVLKKIHGSRDYFQIIFPEVVLEIIPVVKMTDPSKINNITDMSLSHVKYIASKTKNNKKILDEIKLTKSFVAASGCYGAESYVRGFSGYSLELLTIYYGGFINFLKKIEKHKIVDIEKYYKNSNEVLRELNASKLDSPIIVIDPTYKYRNATAGLSPKTFERFIKYAKSFLKSPSLDFFKFKEINSIELKNKAEKDGLKYIELNFSSNKQEGDIAGSKMRKLYDFIYEELKRNEQKIVYDYFYYSGHGNLSKGYFLVKQKDVIKIKGPSLDMKENCDKFKRMHKQNYSEEGHLCFNKKIILEDIIKYTRKVEKEMSASVSGFFVV